MKMLASCVAGMTAVAALAQVGSAVVVFQDDFESYSVGPGSFPQASLDLDPGPPPVGNWFISESGSVESVQVTQDFAPVQGIRALGFGRYGTGAHFTGAEFAPSPAVQADPLKISFKFKDPAPDAEFGGDVDRFQLLGYNKTGGGFSNQVFDITLTSGWWAAGTLTVNFGAYSTNPNDSSRADFTGINFDNDWLDIEILMNFVNHTYTLSVNGNPVANSTNVPFNGDAATANSMQQLAFYSYSSDNTRHVIDDVKIESIPEPTSVALLGLAGIAAMARRRRVIG